MDDLAAFEEHDRPHLHPLLQKLPNALKFRLEVVFTRLDGELDLLNFTSFGLLFLPLLQLIPVLPKIHNFTDHGIGFRGDLHQVQTPFPRQRQGLLNGGNPEVSSIGIDEQNLFGRYLLVYAKLPLNGTTLLSPPILGAGSFGRHRARVPE